MKWLVNVTHIVDHESQVEAFSEFVLNAWSSLFTSLMREELHEFALEEISPYLSLTMAQLTLYI
jgi:hypothetical protein